MIGFILGTIGIGLALLSVMICDGIGLIKHGKNKNSPGYIFLGICELAAFIFYFVIIFF